MLPEHIEFILKAGHMAPSADNSQPWEFSWDGKFLTIMVSTARCNTEVFDSNHPAIPLALGAAIENIDQAASSAGFNIKWDVSSFYNDSESPLVRGEIEYLNSAIQIPSTHPLFDRHTNRHPFKRDALPSSLLIELANMATDGSSLVVVDDGKVIGEIARLINDASKIRFRMKELHEWLFSALRFTPEQVNQGDGLDVRTLHLPPGGRLLLKSVEKWKTMERLNKLGIFRMFSTIEANLFQQAGAIICVVQDSPSSSTILSGRLMERAWITLNHMGIAVQPYFVLTDLLYRQSEGSIPPFLENEAQSLKLRTSEVLRIEDNRILMLLRTGYPTRIAVPSKRLPLESNIYTESR